jgi:hypothetical protein
MRLIALLVFVTLASAADYRVPAGTRTASTNTAETVLPGGRLLTSTGQFFYTGPGTFGLAMSPDGLTVVSADGGPNRFSLTVLRSVEGSWQRQQFTAKMIGAAFSWGLPSMDRTNCMRRRETPARFGWWILGPASGFGASI